MILATLCYLQHAGHTLMLHRTKRANDIHLGKWNGLGGKFEPGGVPEQCVTRRCVIIRAGDPIPAPVRIVDIRGL